MKIFKNKNTINVIPKLSFPSLRIPKDSVPDPIEEYDNENDYSLSKKRHKSRLKIAHSKKLSLQDSTITPKSARHKKKSKVRRSISLTKEV